MFFLTLPTFPVSHSLFPHNFACVSLLQKLDFKKWQNFVGIRAIDSVCVNVTISSSSADLILAAFLTKRMDNFMLTHFLASDDADKKGVIL